MPALIEDYALLSNTRGAALVSREGSVDWLCLPRFDADACLAALLGTPEHGRFLVTVDGPRPRTTRRYRDGTLVLETEHVTPDGAVTVGNFPQALSHIALVNSAALLSRAGA